MLRVLFTFSFVASSISVDGREGFVQGRQMLLCVLLGTRLKHISFDDGRCEYS